ncbi:carbonic anhydrase [Martelella alba]|uniref:carbonic anhydrase n=1 Tax=Martelella alba TaxID=2590451 RepID=A0A506UJ08_9HYPH|nr:carbonic anhydrase [Martelella alba]TPW33292.1 carbonic anhydrase [Martelella alba]
MCQNHSKPGLNRRGFIASGIALAASASIAPFAQAQTTEPYPASPDEAIARLMRGNARSVSGDLINKHDVSGRAERANGQKPFAAILACADSRVVPEMIFDQGPGDLFVVRVAGNFLTEDGLASLEYGVAKLGIQTILVLGHSGCGAVAATIESIEDHKTPPGHLQSLVGAIQPAVYKAMKDHPDNLAEAATIENARMTAEACASSSPIMSEAVAGGKLKVISGVFDIASGKVALS